MKKLNLILVFMVVMSVSVFGSEVSLSLVNQDPDPAVAGDVVELRIGVENLGGDSVDNLMVEIVPSYPFLPINGESLVQEVGSLGAYQLEDDIKIVKFLVRADRDAKAGSYEIKFYHYIEGSISKVQKSFTIDIQNKESAEVIYIDQVELKPGEITTIKFTINNVGSAPLQDLTFKWENEDDIILPVGSDNTKHLNYVEVGDSAELSYDVIASTNADPDLYKLDLTLTYDDPVTGVDKEVSSKAGIYVGGMTDFDVAYSGSSSDGEISFSVANIGSVSASSVTVKIPQQQSWSVSGSNSVIIGNLNEGDYTIASFNLVQKGSASTTIDREVIRAMSEEEKAAYFAQNSQETSDTPVNIDIMYTDSRGIRNTITKEVTVGTSTSTMSTRFSQMGGTTTKDSTTQTIWNNGKWWIIGFVVMACIVFVRKKIKKGRIDDPDYGFFSLFKKRKKKK